MSIAAIRAAFHEVDRLTSQDQRPARRGLIIGRAARSCAGACPPGRTRAGRFARRPGRGPAREWPRPIRPRPRRAWRRCCAARRLPNGRAARRPHSARSVNRPGVLADLDAGRGQDGADGFGNLMVFGIRMRGAISIRWTCVPNALKIEATCTPVAPAPITSSDSGTEERCHASLCVAVKSKPGTASGREVPPVQMMILSAWARVRTGTGLSFAAIPPN